MNADFRPVRNSFRGDGGMPIEGVKKRDFTAAFAGMLWRYALAAALVWTAFIAATVGWNVFEHWNEMLDDARYVAQVSFQKEMLFRLWNDGNGGGDAPATNNTPPSLHLLHAGKRDMVHPNAMMRQAQGHGQYLPGNYSHLTGLKPTRPENAPDTWETKQFKAFEEGKTEVSSVEMIAGQEYMRVMRPLVTEAGCLTCHSEQDYKVGSISGGFSVSVPLAPLRIHAQRHLVSQIIGSCVVWLLGLAVIGFSARRVYVRDRERAKVSEALQESEKKYRILFDNSRDALMTLEPPSWAFTSGNASTVAMFRAKDEKDFISHEPWDLSPERQPDGRSSVEKAREMIETTLREGSHFFEWIHKRINGEEFAATVLLTCIESEGKRFLQATVRDVTEHKRAEEALRLFRVLVDRSSDAIEVLDPETGRFLDVNQQGCLDLGYSREEYLALSVFDIDPMVDQSAFAKVVEELRKSGGLKWDGIHRRKDGSTFPVEVNIKYVQFDRDYMVAVVRDITERRRVEEDLLNANMRLRKSMEELNLTQEKVIQQERLSALGQMASGIAHDFNNVLMPIVGFSELLLSDSAELDDRTESRHMIKMILEAGKDARQIVRRLRAIYREDDDTDYKLVNISRIVESAISLTMSKWKEEMSAKGVTIEMATDFHPVPQIKGNESEIREALINLIFNAVDAMPKGGVITFHVYPKNKNSIVLEVVDTGLGMDQETVRRCMEPFFTTKGVQGSGLGLAMVHGIIERHEGVIEIESKPGTGTTIRMLFPVPVAVENIDEKLESEVDRLSSLRILVIDDEARARNLIARILQSGGNHVELAEDGPAGLDMLRQGKFDLVITDRAMPKMSGDEVASEAHKLRPEMPIIMLTGFGDIMKDSGVCPSGVCRVMTKPVTQKELRHVMASVLRKAGRR